MRSRVSSPLAGDGFEHVQLLGYGRISSRGNFEHVQDRCCFVLLVTLPSCARIPWARIRADRSGFGWSSRLSRNYHEADDAETTGSPQYCPRRRPCGAGRRGTHAGSNRSVLQGLQHARSRLPGVGVLQGFVYRASQARTTRDAGGDRHRVLRAISRWPFPSRSIGGGSTRGGAQSRTYNRPRRPTATSQLVASEQPYVRYPFPLWVAPIVLSPDL
jgi:hypothetical protein